MGAVMEKLGLRKAEMVNMNTSVQGYMRLEFKIPARGLIGYSSEFMTDTKGNGIMNHVLTGFEPFKGEVPEDREVLWLLGKQEKQLLMVYIMLKKEELFL